MEFLQSLFLKKVATKSNQLAFQGRKNTVDRNIMISSASYSLMKYSIKKILKNRLNNTNGHRDT